MIHLACQNRLSKDMTILSMLLEHSAILNKVDHVNIQLDFPSHSYISVVELLCLLCVKLA